MSARVVFHRAGTNLAIQFTELGSTPDGAWGLVDDEVWLATAGDPGVDALELLFLSPGAYAHAVRGLDVAQAAAAVAHRLTTFSIRVPEIAVGVVEMRMRDCIAALGPSEAEVHLRGDLLTAAASFITLPRFAGSRQPRLFDALREGDARIIFELESPSVRATEAADPTGDERSTRRRFATQVGALAARSGRPADEAALLPYYDVERTYLLMPTSADLEAAAHTFHDPTLPFRGGLVMPLSERNVAAVEAAGHQATVVFPARGPFMGALEGLTAAQLEVEINERLAGPGFVPFLRALRLQQATLRVAVRLITGQDQQVEPTLGAQVAEETVKLPLWLGGGASSPAAAAAVVGEVAEDAAFLMSFCLRRGALDRSGALAPLARALSHIAESLRS